MHQNDIVDRTNYSLENPQKYDISGQKYHITENATFG